MSVQAGESYRFKQSVSFDGHKYGFPQAGECLIRRGTDEFTWDGAAFVSGENWNATTVDLADPDGPLHYYDWTVPIGSANGLAFTVTIRLLDDPGTESGGTMIVRETGGGGGDVFIYPPPIFDD